MGKHTDVRASDAALYFIPVTTRVPLKFGPETLTSVTCARACVSRRGFRRRYGDRVGERLR